MKLMNMKSTRAIGFVALAVTGCGFAYGQWTGTQVPRSTSTSQMIVVKQVDWVETEVLKQAGQVPIIRESGTMYIAPDGRVLDEKRIYRGSEETLVVRLLDHANNTKLVLDFDRKVAVRTPLRRKTTRRGPRSYTVGPTLVTDNRKAPLGEKTVDGITLEGDRQTMNLNTPNGTIFVAHETWIYRLDVHPAAIIVMEHRYEGGNSIMDRRITQVRTVTISEDMLELPDDFVERFG